MYHQIIVSKILKYRDVKSLWRGLQDRKFNLSKTFTVILSFGAIMEVCSIRVTYSVQQYKHS